MKPNKTLNGIFTQDEMDRLRADGYSFGGVLLVPPRMDSAEWQEAVAELSNWQRAMAKRMLESLERRVPGPEGDTSDTE